MIRKVEKSDKSWIRKFIKEHWCSESVFVHGKLYRPHELPGFIAEKSGKNSDKIIAEAKSNQEQIQTLERFLKENPGRYDWKVHNELRHLYSSTNPRKSAEHSNVILRNSPMDGYILSILSGWQLDKDAEKARANLLMQAKSYPDLKFVTAACLLKAGDLYAAEGKYGEAKTYYITITANDSPEMLQYQAIANQRLKDINEPQQIRKP